MMRIAFALSLFFVSCTTALAQKGYFLFIQSEGRQPFYVRLGDRTFSSTVGGHVIIPELRDSSYRVTVGFPRNQFPEQQYSVMFNQSDLALDLKKAAGENGWKLFNTQTSEWLPARQDFTGTQEQVWGERKKDNGFAALMAAVVNDSSVLYTTVVRAPVVPPKKEAPKQEAVVINTDTAKASLATAVDQEVKQAQAGMPTVAVDSPLKVTGATIDTAVVKAPNAPTDSNAAATKVVDSEASVAGGITKPVITSGKPAIARVGELTEAKGKKIIYTDSTANGVDTIALVIDFEKDTLLMASRKQSVEEALKNQVPSLDIVQAKPVDSLAKKTDTALAAGLTPGVTAKKDTITKAVVAVTDNRKDTVKDSATATMQIPAVAEVKKDTATEKKEGIVAKKEDTVVKKEDPVIVKTDVSGEVKKEAVAEVKKEEVKKEKEEGKKENEPKKEVPAPVKQEPVKTDAQILPDTTSVKKATPNISTGTSAKKLVMFNSDCQMVASEQDVDKLRVKIMAETNIDGRLNASKKFYRSKCLITRQVKALSELFMNDEEKYRFFETSYPHVYDTANYKLLLNLLTEEPYIGRFKTLVKI